MTNIMNNLKPYIESLGLYASLYIDSFTGSSEEMVIRHDPGSAKVTAYMDGSREGEFNFSLHAKSQDAEQATSQLSELMTKLDLRSDIDLTDLIKVKIEPVSSVRFITKTEKLEFIYSSDYILQYFERR